MFFLGGPRNKMGGLGLPSPPHGYAPASMPMRWEEREEGERKEATVVSCRERSEGSSIRILILTASSRETCTCSLCAPANHHKIIPVRSSSLCCTNCPRCTLSVRACEAQHVVAAQQGKAEETRQAVPAETAWARFCCSTLNMKWTVISYYIVDIYSFPLTRHFFMVKMSINSKIPSSERLKQKKNEFGKIFNRIGKIIKGILYTSSSLHCNTAAHLQVGKLHSMPLKY